MRKANGPELQAGNGLDPKDAGGIRPRGASIFDDLEYAEAKGITATAPTRKLITRLAVKRPERRWFWRRNPEFAFQCWLYDDQDEGENYYVHDCAADEMIGFARLVVLYLCITRQGTLFVFPVRLDAHGGGALWADSARRAAAEAVHRWVSMRSNRQEGAYEILVAEGQWPDPEWPELTRSEILKLAFGDRVIDSADHPVIAKLRGLTP